MNPTDEMPNDDNVVVNLADHVKSSPEASPQAPPSRYVPDPEEDWNPPVGATVLYWDRSLIGRKLRSVDAEAKNVALNGQGSGPYPAMIVQDFGGGYKNLRVFASGGAWTEFSAGPVAAGGTNWSRGWTLLGSGKPDGAETPLDHAP